MSKRSKQDELSAFFETAQRLFEDPALEAHLPRLVSDLPPVSIELLELLGSEAEVAALRQPRRSWAIAALTDAAASRSNDLFLRARAAWDLAKAANEWVRPQRVEAAIERAQAGFADLGETGWAAACEWQRYANPWTRNDFRLAAEKLSEALREMEAAGMRDQLPGCRCSLAYAFLLQSEFGRALDLIQAVEGYCLERGDRLGYARCLLHRSSAYRRKGDIHASRTVLQRAQEVFESLDARIDLAKALYQLGIVQYIIDTDAQASIDLLNEARAIFLVADLPLWVALCENQAAYKHLVLSNLGVARSLQGSARTIYSRYQVFGSLADNYYDSAQMDLYQGNYPAGLEGFRQAGEYYTRVGAPLPASSALMMQGYVNVQMGAYQTGLQILERAYKQLVALDSPTRLSECEIDLAEVWIQLRRPDRAIKYLDLALQHLDQTGGGNLLRVHLYKFRARALILQDCAEDAILSLRLAIELAEQHQLQLQEARSRLFLGEVFCELERPNEALEVLLPAESAFASLENVFGQITAWLFIGEAYFQQGEMDKAQACWERARSTGLELLPDISWQVYAGLARLALLDGDHPGALRNYHHVSQSLLRLRSGFWQPALAGTFFQRPAGALDQAVAFAARLPSPTDALQFLEESKAQTIAQNLALNRTFENGVDSPELQAVLSEIRWLHQELQKNGAQGSFVYRTRQTRFIQKIRKKNSEYEALVTRLERERFARAEGLPLEPAGPRKSFELDSFRRLANECLGERWVALDYHLDGNELTGVILDPEGLSLWQKEISPGAQLALAICAKTRDYHTIQVAADLAQLGESLLSQQLVSRLEPDTMLLIAPQRSLYKIPWAILPAGKSGEPLISLCTPCIVPSLHYLSVLWSRRNAVPDDPGSGFLLAVSNFQDRYDPLPLVKDEVSRLRRLPGLAVTALEDGEATRAGLSTFVRTHSLDRFAFLHLATHAFPDPLSGYMSGFALHDKDLYVTEIQDLAPLPALVTLSACSGAHSLVFEGDELVGIPIACLASGAATVVGSLWPVFDGLSAGLMEKFYRGLLSGLSPAQALAAVQRGLDLKGVDPEFWGSYLCFGAP